MSGPEETTSSEPTYTGTQKQDGKKGQVVLKVGMVGDAQIGKTSLMVKYVEGTFDEDYIQTLGKNDSHFDLKICPFINPFEKKLIFFSGCASSILFSSFLLHEFTTHRSKFYGEIYLDPGYRNYFLHLGSWRYVSVLVLFPIRNQIEKESENNNTSEREGSLLKSYICWLYVPLI